MDKQEVLDKIAIAQAQLEWSHDIGIAAALDVAMKRVKDWERLKKEIMKMYTWITFTSDDSEILLIKRDAVLRLMAEMENEDE